jgi:hypothetical protein
MKDKNSSIMLLFAFAVLLLAGCHSGSKQTEDALTADSVSTVETTCNGGTLPSKDSISGTVATEVKTELPVVYIYNFHVTNRCPSCIAIEDATTKTLNTYFPAELKQGRIKRQVINVDDEANKKIAEKYQAFGSGLFITRSYKGKETTLDLTGDGFKFARNKEDRFIEILKSKITEYLK